MTTDLFYLALTALLTALLWVPFIIMRVPCRGRPNPQLTTRSYLNRNYRRMYGALTGRTSTRWRTCPFSWPWCWLPTFLAKPTVSLPSPRPFISGSVSRMHSYSTLGHPTRGLQHSRLAGSHNSLCSTKSLPNVFDVNRELAPLCGPSLRGVLSGGFGRAAHPITQRDHPRVVDIFQGAVGVEMVVALPDLTLDRPRLFGQCGDQLF